MWWMPLWRAFESREFCGWRECLCKLEFLFVPKQHADLCVWSMHSLRQPTLAPKFSKCSLMTCPLQLSQMLNFAQHWASPHSLHWPSIKAARVNYLILTLYRIQFQAIINTNNTKLCKSGFPLCSQRITSEHNIPGNHAASVPRTLNSPNSGSCKHVFIINVFQWGPSLIKS